MIIEVLWALIGGTVIGLLGKAVAPGNRDNIPLWLTVICGIGGAAIGTWAYGQFFAYSSPGVDWWRHTWQIAAAAILVMLAAGLTGRRRD